MTDLPRSPDQIVRRIKDLDTKADPTGFVRSRLLEALPFDRATEFLEAGKHDHTPERWEANRLKTVADARNAIIGYLPFAWQRANSRRMGSAVKSVAFFKGLLWLIGDHDAIGLYDTLTDLHSDDNRFEFYGKLALVLVSQYARFPWTNHDDDKWFEDPDPDATVEVEPITANDALRPIAGD